MPADSVKHLSIREIILVLAKVIITCLGFRMSGRVGGFNGFFTRNRESSIIEDLVANGITEQVVGYPKIHGWT